MQTIDVINQLNQLHEKYKGYIRKCIVTVVVDIMKGVIIFPIFILLRLRRLDTTIINIILFMILGYFVKQCFSCKRQYARIYKEKFVLSVMNQTFSDVRVDWNHGFTKEQVSQMGIVEMGDDFKSDMHVWASYQGVKFEQSYVIITCTDSDGDVKSHLGGHIFMVDTQKKDIASVNIVSKTFQQPAKYKKSMYEDVQMESVDFNERFDVRTCVTRSADAFYALTPQVMEHLVTLQKRRKMISACFVCGKLYIACWSMKNIFDGNIRKPLVYTDEMNKIRDEFQDVKEIVELVS